MLDRLETPKQLAARIGISERQVRSLIQSRKLEHVMIGSRVHIPAGAFERFVEQNTVTPCQDETKARSCDGLQSVDAITSPGQSTVAAASARLARQTANELKRSSPTGCKQEDGESAQVIPLKSS
jgi:excisionase family DNA binding protein